MLGITSNTLVRSSHSSSGPAGGASDGYGLGLAAAGPDRRCMTPAAGALRVDSRPRESYGESLSTA